VSETSRFTGSIQECATRRHASTSGGEACLGRPETDRKSGVIPK